MTPLTDQLRARLQATAATRGQMADLARWLASRYPGKASSYRVTVYDFLAGKANPAGELTLAIQTWLDGLTTTPRKDGRASGRLVRDN